MNLVAHGLTSKGNVAFFRRFGTIAARFSLTSSRAERHLAAYLSILRKYGCNATFPITAVVLRRNARFIRFLADEGVEIAVHGYVHTDHSRLAEGDQREQIARAVDVFEAEGIHPVGFRGPYLRYNDATLAAVESLGFGYVSNETINYDVVDRNRLRPAARDEYERALHLYAAIRADDALVRPRMRGHLVEIPVAMPDDEILVDRLGYDSGGAIGHVWARLVDITHAAGEVLTLQLHPERSGICGDAVSAAISAAQSKTPPVWIAQLRDIAAWWRQRSRYRLRITPAGNGTWLVSGPKDRNASILLRNVNCDRAATWRAPYKVMTANWGIVQCPVMPVIGVSQESQVLRQVLEEEGYAVGVDRDPGRYPLFFDRPGCLSTSELAATIRSIEQSAAPLARLSRWPGAAASALAITGDIDALTLGDFVRRVWEVR